MLKKTHKNIYGLSGKIFPVVYYVVFGIWFLCLNEILMSSWPLNVMIPFIIAFILLCVVFGQAVGSSSHKTIIPYRRMDGFEFLGLYNLTGKNITESKDVLSRAEEARYIQHTLEEIIFPQNSVKQALCLVGESGCGKSTIISFLRYMYDEYAFYDFSGNYMSFEAYLNEVFGDNLDQSIASITKSKKIVFILDQFERFFFLKKEEKNKIKKCIEILSRKNTAVIISLRQEYLADFMKEFDMNNLKGQIKTNNISGKGILNPLISVLQAKEVSQAIKRKNGSGVMSCNGEKIIDNIQVHIEQRGKHGIKNTKFEPVGATLFYCNKQNEATMQRGGQTIESTRVSSKLEKLFGDFGNELFLKYKYEPLIKQQIVFQMAEYDKKVRKMTDEELMTKYSMEDKALISEYFDIQLASVNDYLNASRILYLLSVARINHVAMKRENIEQGMSIDMSGPEGYRQFLETMDKLEKLQLIRKKNEGSDLEFEIAHDYIASEFINYSRQNINRNIMSALDIFITEYLDNNQKKHLEEKKKHTQKMSKDKYFFIMTAVCLICMVAVEVIYRFIYDPWNGILKDFNPCGEIHLIFPLFINVLSVIYLYHMYDKVIKYYRGRKQHQCRIIFFFSMLLAVAAVTCYPHYLCIDGVDLAMVGLNYVFLLGDDYQQSCRNELRAYGMRTALMGFVFSIAHILFLICTPTFEIYIVYFEAVAFSLLVGFAYMSHMTTEYLNGRRADASSEKIVIKLIKENTDN